VESGRVVRVLSGHENHVFSAVYSPSGDRILTASRDQTARLWDTEGNLLAVLRGHAGEVNSAVFDPLGDRILTASGDGTVRVWLARPEDLLKLADERITREFTEAERERYTGLLIEEEE
jgi:WD40 repeat protein